MRLRTVGLALLAAACARAGRPATVAPTLASPPTAMATPAPASEPEPEPTPSACPPIDHAALEPVPPPPDPRTIALTRVFPRKQARPEAGTKPLSIDLGVVSAPSSDPDEGGWGVGMGWHGLQASWVASSISPEVEAPLAEWEAAWKVLAEHQRASYLLGRRLRHARSVEPPQAWGGLACVEQAVARVERDERDAKAAVERASRVLQEVVEGLPSRRPGDDLVLGYLLEEQLPHPHSPEDAARPIALFTKVADDASLDRELRARAAEQRARVQTGNTEALVRALEQVLSLTRDPELEIETLVKLADLSHDDAKSEALRVRILKRLDEHDGGWRVAEQQAALAEDRLDRGAYTQARDDAARCAQSIAAGSDFPDDPDPWGCAMTLAESLAELGGAPKGTTVPLAFLGPLAIASIDAALSRHDWNQARHVATLLLDELPEAAEAPQAIATLMSLVPHDERAALAERKARDYGPDGAWADAQRRRLAWEHEPEALAQQLAALVDLRDPTEVHVPTTPDERAEDLRERASDTAWACIDALGDRASVISVRVDTTGTTPQATARGGTPAARACLQRAARARFRSVGPARIRFRVASE